MFKIGFGFAIYIMYYNMDEKEIFLKKTNYN